MAVEEVAVVEEDVVEIRINTTKPGMVLTPNIFIRISAVLIGTPFRG